MAKAKLLIKTDLNSIVVVGAFCQWNIDNAIRVERKPGNKCIVVDDLPKGEYRVLCCRSWQHGEVYPTDRRQMGNRYFSGIENETIHCYFN